MSTIEVNKITPVDGGTTTTLGDSGDTFTAPTGVGLTVTDEVKTNKISPASGTTFTLGDSGDTFNIPAGATIANAGTATGFGSAVAGTESFKVTMDDNQAVSSGVYTLVNYDKEIFDNGGNFDTSNKKFVAPATGNYQFNITLSFATDGSYGLDNVYMQLYKNGTGPISNQLSIINAPTHTGSGSFDTASIVASLLINLSANDYIQIYARSIKNSNATTTSLYSDQERRSEWSGFRVT